MCGIVGLFIKDPSLEPEGKQTPYLVDEAVSPHLVDASVETFDEHGALLGHTEDARRPPR